MINYVNWWNSAEFIVWRHILSSLYFKLFSCLHQKNKNAYKCYQRNSRDGLEKVKTLDSDTDYSTLRSALGSCYEDFGIFFFSQNGVGRVYSGGIKWFVLNKGCSSICLVFLGAIQSASLIWRQGNSIMAFLLVRLFGVLHICSGDEEETGSTEYFDRQLGWGDWLNGLFLGLHNHFDKSSVVELFTVHFRIRSCSKPKISCSLAAISTNSKSSSMSSPSAGRQFCFFKSSSQSSKQNSYKHKQAVTCFSWYSKILIHDL